MRDRRDVKGEPVYWREMPGGGFVAVFVTPLRAPGGARPYRGEIVLERRADDERRVGHIPPVIVGVSGTSPQEVFDELFPVAASNAGLAAACLRAGVGGPRLAVPRAVVHG